MVRVFSGLRDTGLRREPYVVKRELEKGKFWFNTVRYVQ